MERSKIGAWKREKDRKSGWACKLAERSGGEVFSHGAKYNRRPVGSFVYNVFDAFDARSFGGAKAPRAISHELLKRRCPSVSRVGVQTRQETRLFSSLTRAPVSDTTHVRAPMEQSALFHLPRTGICTTFVTPIVRGDWCSGLKCISFSLLIGFFLRDEHCWISRKSCTLRY